MVLRRYALVALVACVCGAAGTWGWLKLRNTGGANEQPTPAAPRSVAAGAPRVLDLPEARATSAATGLPILLLLTPPVAICEPARCLEGTFFAPEALARLAKVSVPSRLVVDHANLSDVARDFLAHHQGVVIPSFLVLRHDGQVLRRQMGRLYPAYDPDQHALEGDWGPFLSVGELADLVDEAVGRAQREDRRLEAISVLEDVASLTEQAVIFEQRDRTEEAKAVAKRAAVLPATGEVGSRLAGVLERLGEKEAAARVLRALLVRYAGSPDSVRWGLALHRLGVPAPSEGGAPAPDLATLQERAAQRGDLLLEALVRAERAHEALASDDRTAADEHVTWFASRAETLQGDASEKGRALLRFAEVARDLGRGDLAGRWAERVVRELPDRAETAELKHGLLDDMRRAAPSPAMR